MLVANHEGFARGDVDVQTDADDSRLGDR